MAKSVKFDEADIAVTPLIAQPAFFSDLYELARLCHSYTRSILLFGFKHEYITETQSFVDAIDFDVSFLVYLLNTENMYSNLIVNDG